MQRIVAYIFHHKPRSIDFFNLYEPVPSTQHPEPSLGLRLTLQSP
jgi:hypothetical protein